MIACTSPARTSRSTPLRMALSSSSSLTCRLLIFSILIPPPSPPSAAPQVNAGAAPVHPGWPAARCASGGSRAARRCTRPADHDQAGPAAATTHQAVANATADERATASSTEARTSRASPDRMRSVRSRICPGATVVRGLSSPADPGTAGGRRRRRRGGERLKDSASHPTLPSRLIATSFCASMANSIGSACSTSRQKPLTTSATASSSSMPRWRQ